MVTSQSATLPLMTPSDSLTLPLLIAPPDFHAISSPISSTKQSESAVTNPVILLMSVMPSESLQLPILSPLSNFKQNDWSVSAPPMVSTTTVPSPIIASSTVAPNPIEVPTTPESSISLSLFVTTRPPNTLHHFTDDFVVRSEFSNGVQRIESEREKYEIRYTDAYKDSVKVISVDA